MHSVPLMAIDVCPGTSINYPLMTSEDSQMPFEGLLKYTINFLFHKLISNSRVGHRNRLNIFDVVKVINSLSISHNELRIYLKWLRQNAEACGLIYSIFPKNQIEYFNNCKMDLTFCVDVNETKKPGFDYFPPIPSSFTFKFTPVTQKNY